MEISGYIAELLGDQDYVVLPGVGAFVSEYRAARIPEGGTTVEPPSRKITFNAGMKMNDGFLTGYITSKTGASLQEARRMVSGYADDILYRLDRDGHTALKNMGTLQKQEGKITFTPLEELSRLPGAYGFKAVFLEAANLVAESPEATPSPSSPGKEMNENPKRLLSPGRRRSMKPLLVVVPLLLVIAALLFFLVPHHINGLESPPPGSARNSSVTSGNPTPSLVPGTSERQKDFPVTGTTEVTIADSSAISGPGSSTPDSAGTASDAPAPTPAIPAVSPAGTPQKTWYVIAGSFQSWQNGDKFARELSNKGYHPFSLGKVGNYYFISTDSFKTEREALRAVNQYNNLHPGSEAWVFLPRQKKQRPPL